LDEVNCDIEAGENLAMSAVPVPEERPPWLGLCCGLDSGSTVRESERQCTETLSEDQRGCGKKVKMGFSFQRISQLLPDSYQHWKM